LTQDPDDALINLAHFRLDLPDPQQELCIQTNPLGNFKLFPKLPTELRVMVWKATVRPPRLIDLELECFWLRDHIKIPYKNAPPLPSTLYANRESRREALKYYGLFYTIPQSRQPFLEYLANPGYREPSRPVCINIPNDVLTFHGISALAYTTACLHLEDQEYGFPGVQTLAISHVDTGDHHGLRRKSAEKRSDWQIFPSLQKIILLADKSETEDWITDKTTWGGEALRVRILEQLERLALLEPTRSVPEVVLMPARPMSKELCYL